jgi:hypothetical protein
MTANTVRVIISPALLGAVFPPSHRAPAPPISIHQLAIDMIQARELRALDITETQELPIIKETQHGNHDTND